MNKRRTVLAALILAPVAAIALAAGGADDMSAIKQATTDFGTAWNKHDAKAIAACWAKDGDLIDPAGKKMSGQEAVEKYFAEEHTGKGALAHCTFELKSDSVRLITPDVSLEDWDVVLTGLTPEGAPAPIGPQTHRVVVIRKKEGGKWPIAAARPGVPQPAGDGGAPMMPPPMKPAHH
jgi:uncharacterized protein (TIGR02246 family)